MSIRLEMKMVATNNRTQGALDWVIFCQGWNRFVQWQRQELEELMRSPRPISPNFRERLDTVWTTVLDGPVRKRTEGELG